MDKILHTGTYLAFIEREGWEFVRRQGCSGVVVIIAVTDDDHLLLVEQYRPPVNARVIELPAGLSGDQPELTEESLLTAAQRELYEETGYEAARWTTVTQGPISAGLTDQVITLFRAENLTQTGPGGGDEHEDILVHTIPRTEIPRWLTEKQKQGCLIDPKIYAALFFSAQAPSADESL